MSEHDLAPTSGSAPRTELTSSGHRSHLEASSTTPTRHGVPRNGYGYREEQQHQYSYNEENDVDSLFGDENFSLAGSVVSITETVVTGIQTSLSHWKLILFGQLLAMSMGLRGGATAYLYLECNVMIPTTQTGVVYFLLFAGAMVFRCICSQTTRNGNGASVTQRNSMVPTVMFDLSMLHGNSKARMKQLQASARREYSLGCFHGIRLAIPWYYYLAIALLDLEGNFLTYKALQFTSLKSASMLDTLAIPTVLIASYIGLRKRYRLAHYLGAVICLAGAFLMVLSDYKEEQEKELEEGEMSWEQQLYYDEKKANEQEWDQYSYYSNYDGKVNNAASNESLLQSSSIRGDLLAAFGGMCWGLKDTLTEHVLHRGATASEYWTYLGAFGLTLAIIQALIFERYDVIGLFQSSAEKEYYGAEGFGSYFDPSFEETITGSTNDLSGSNSVSTTESAALTSPYASQCTMQETWSVFSAILFVFTVYYIGFILFLQRSEAALLQLSLLSSDLYAVVFSIIEEHTLPTYLFVVAMVIILFGVLVYESVEEPSTAASPTSYLRPQTTTRKQKRFVTRGIDNHDLRLEQSNDHENTLQEQLPAMNSPRHHHGNNTGSGNTMTSFEII